MISGFSGVQWRFMNPTQIEPNASTEQRGRAVNMFANFTETFSRVQIAVRAANEN